MTEKINIYRKRAETGQGHYWVRYCPACGDEDSWFTWESCFRNAIRHSYLHDNPKYRRTKLRLIK